MVTPRSAWALAGVVYLGSYYASSLCLMLRNLLNSIKEEKNLRLPEALDIISKILLLWESIVNLSPV